MEFIYARIKLIEFGCNLITLDCNSVNLMKFDYVRVKLIMLE
jgi:hypothetical protein